MRALWILMIAATITFTMNAADLAGTWKGSMETQAGPTSVAITIQSGATLTGKVVMAEYEGTIEKGKVDGNKISFEVSIGPGKVIFHGTFAGNQIRFDVTGTQGDNYKLTSTRVSPESCSGAWRANGPPAARLIHQGNT